MVEAAELHQIREAGFTAVSPVFDVVPFDEVPRGTAGKAAAAVTGLECAVNGGRDAAGLAPDVEGHAIAVFGEAHDTRIAGETPGAFAGKPWAVLELRASRSARIGEHFGIYVNDDVIAFASGA